MGTPVLYTAEHPALAGFEKLVHGGVGLAQAPLRHRLVLIDVPEVEVEHMAHVPNDPVAVGQAWIDAAEKPLLRVPSIVVPHAWNYLVNVRHPAVATLNIVENVAFVFDPRLTNTHGDGA